MLFKGPDSLEASSYFRELQDRRFKPSLKHRPISLSLLLAQSFQVYRESEGVIAKISRAQSRRGCVNLTSGFIRILGQPQVIDGALIWPPKAHRCVSVYVSNWVWDHASVPAPSLPEDVTWTWSRSWKSVTVLPLEFTCTPLGQKRVCKGRLECFSPLLTIGVCVYVYVCACLSSSSFMTVRIWMRAKENHFVSAWGQFASRWGLSLPPTPHLSQLRSISALCVYKHSRIM